MNLPLHTTTDQPDGRLVRRIVLKRILSFGPDSTVLEMRSLLNVLIGPNAVGKSNLIEALSVMRAPPAPASPSNSDLRGVIRRGGGVTEWIWKGEPQILASINLVFFYLKRPPLRHVLSFGGDEQGFRLADEKVENEVPSPGETEPYFYYRFQHGQPVGNTKAVLERRLARETINTDLSILAQRRDPEQYPEIAHLIDAYKNIRIYRAWSFGRNGVFREPQKTDMRNDRLEEDFSNLGLFLSRLCKNPGVKAAILDGLKDLYEGVMDFEIVVEGGTVQVFFIEGDFSVPATRLSDGTLRYLCLLAILCDPEPPPLICIEEPELGLHPDIRPKLANLLVQASLRSQLIVTTHSDVIIDALTYHPEAVVVCEKHEGATVMKRLEKKELEVWLTKYSLGQLWTSVQLTGTRWRARQFSLKVLRPGPIPTNNKYAAGRLSINCWQSVDGRTECRD